MKKQKTRSPKSDHPYFNDVSSSIRKDSRHSHRHRHRQPSFKSEGPTRNSTSRLSKTHLSNNLKRQPYGFAWLPNDLLLTIAASFLPRNLRSASLVCRAWRDALDPLWDGVKFLKRGKRFKHGRCGVKPDLNKALDSFLQGAARGYTLAMVDAGLIYWEMGNREKGIALYRKAAELGDPKGQCNLAISFLQADPPSYKEAVKWLYRASFAGYARAQYQLALCLHQGRGVDQNLTEAARWYRRAAEGGYARAMYNTSLCYSFGKGLVQNDTFANRWMMRAAAVGHSKAQLEHGLGLYSEGDEINAVVYLELATLAGETSAAHVKNSILQGMSRTSRARAMRLADERRPLPSNR
ncbi:hypothetical protein ACH5RR_030730 [Cinchona calisaya]|uniref:F-box domain-containing protein n=1 Tax=Cinchona calisaya TaxID=153742 RepID=A0ABD2YYB9_9GENT